MLRSHHLALQNMYEKRLCVGGAEMWWLESPKLIRREMCVRACSWYVVSLTYSIGA